VFFGTQFCISFVLNEYYSVRLAQTLSILRGTNWNALAISRSSCLNLKNKNKRFIFRPFCRGVKLLKSEKNESVGMRAMPLTTQRPVTCTYWRVETWECPKCSICLAEYETGGSVIRLVCGHMFHTHCFDDLDRFSRELRQDLKCPVCRHFIPRVDDLCRTSPVTLRREYPIRSTLILPPLPTPPPMIDIDTVLDQEIEDLITALGLEHEETNGVRVTTPIIVVPRMLRTPRIRTTLQGLSPRPTNERPRPRARNSPNARTWEQQLRKY